jgi:hypothetical protein
VKLTLLITLLWLPLTAQPPAETTSKDVQNFLHDTAEDLSNKDTSAFLSHFDPKMPGYETLHYEIEGLIARDAVVSTIEIVTDTPGNRGDDHQRELDLDWVLTVDTDRPRRQIVKVRIEKQGKKWKIVALDPIEFFKPTAAP